ncbi:MAG TPA: efflux RND transporter periplasmic adaptor subunit [Sphingomicrobium sp.]|jgi:RND family efflux transporter MFP subunit|nr:efflux RND transporter periplasmic adaptor subunit [Sphingomicrobium sp.]
MYEMNQETPIRSSDSDTLVVLDERARRRKRLAIIGAGLVALVAIVLAVMMMTGGDEEQAAAEAAAKEAAAIPKITVVVPGRQQVAREISATGTIAARRDMPVGIAGQGGRVTSVRVDAGQWVDAGQVLATVDRSVQAEVAAQQAAQIAAAKADAELAQNNYERALQLVDRGFVSKADLEAKRAARDAANAQVRVAQAQLAQTRAQIGQLNVVAPTSGLILDRSVEVGQIVSPGSGALFRIAQGGQMEVQAKLAEAALAQVHVGTPATVIPVGSNVRISGTVWQVEPIIDPVNRQGVAHVAVPYQRVLRPGGFAEVSLMSGTANVPLLPQSAVLSDDKGNYVYVVGSDDRVQRRGVKVGEVDDNGVTIVEGLTGQERVVASAGAFLNSGDKVRPVREAAR